MAAAASPLRWALLRSSSFLLLLAFLQPRASHCLDNGVALTPPMAWTSWNLARFDVSAEMVLGMADALEKTGLKALGWDTLQIDEGWEACESYAGPHPGAWPKNFLTSCATPAPRDAKGWIVANETKFPGGIKAIADTLHGRGFKVGVYTSASERACGGNWGSHGHEAADAAAFEAWGVDWVKVDDCNYGTVEQLVQNQRAISLAIQAVKRPIVIQMGAFVFPLLYNPHVQPRPDYTNKPSLAPWVWAPNISHTWYTGADKGNSWRSTLRNVQINMQGRLHQKPGAYNFAGDLWCGLPQSNEPGEYMPAMSAEEDRSTYAMWVIMAAPLMLGCDVRNLTDNALRYLTNADLVAVNQDPWGLQGSLHQLTDNGEQIYVKPLSDGSFAFALWNLAKTNATIEVEWSNLFPESFASMHVRDLWTQRDLGSFEGSWTADDVPGHGVAMIRATPVKSPPPPPPPSPSPSSSAQLMVAPCMDGGGSAARQQWVFRQDGGLSLRNDSARCLTYTGDGNGLVLQPCAQQGGSCTNVTDFVDCHPTGGEASCHKIGCCWVPSNSHPYCFRPASNASMAENASLLIPSQQWQFNESSGAVVSGEESPPNSTICFDIREQPLQPTQSARNELGGAVTGSVRNTVGAVDGYFPCRPTENQNEVWHWVETSGHLISNCSSQCPSFAGHCVTAPGPAAPPPPPYTGLRVWPVPQSEQFSGAPVLLAADFAVHYNGSSAVAKDAATRYTLMIRASVAQGGTNANTAHQHSATSADAKLQSLVLSIESHSDTLTNWTHANEGYTIKVNPSGEATVVAHTPFGALRACESFSQMVEQDVVANGSTGVGLRFNNVEITDKPRYPVRSVMVDISRRLYPMPLMRSILDAMSYAKLNVLHLHLTDFGRYSIESKVFPELNVGYPSGGYPAGVGDGKFWTQDEVRELVVYARLRGVRLIPEMEMPQHARCLLPLVKTQGLQFCNVSFPVMLYDDPEGKTVAVLKKLVDEMASLFPDDVFHLGMDEAQCSVPVIENDPLDAGACGVVCNATTIRSLEHKMLLHVQDVLGKRPMAWQNALFDCGDIMGCEPASARRTKSGKPFGVNPSEKPATDGAASTVINIYAASHIWLDGKSAEQTPLWLAANATAQGFYATQTDANHLYLDTGTTSPAGYAATLWYDISGGLITSEIQKQHFLGGGVCLWSDSYCSLAAECGGWATCIGGSTPTSKCAGSSGWMQDSKYDRQFIQSAGGLLFPRSNIAAGSLWNYNATLSHASEEFVARTRRLAAVMEERDVMGLCPPGCSCSFGGRCGQSYSPGSAN